MSKRERRPTKKNPYGIREYEIQGVLKKHLEFLGYTVLVTSAGLAPIIVDGEKHFAKGHLATPGVPDLLITHRTWNPNEWMGLELKVPGGAVSTAQRDLAAAGHIVICDSHESALEALKLYNATRLGKMTRTKP